MVVAAEFKAGGSEAAGEVALAMLMLDLRWRRCLIMRLMRLPALRTDPESPEASESELELLLEESDDDEESIMSCKTPGWDSASIISCGMLSYM